MLCFVLPIPNITTGRSSYSVHQRKKFHSPPLKILISSVLQLKQLHSSHPNDFRGTLCCHTIKCSLSSWCLDRLSQDIPNEQWNLMCFFVYFLLKHVSHVSMTTICYHCEWRRNVLLLHKWHQNVICLVRLAGLFVCLWKKSIFHNCMWFTAKKDRCCEKLDVFTHVTSDW